jgi:hypothetical protein
MSETYFEIQINFFGQDSNSRPSQVEFNTYKTSGSQGLVVCEPENKLINYSGTYYVNITQVLAARK